MVGRLQQLSELLDREPRVPDDPAHGEGVHRVVARNGEDSDAVSHHDVLSFPGDAETRLLEGADRIEVIDPR